MHRRWPANLVLALGGLVIIAHALVRGVGMAMPFAPTYRTPYVEPVTLGALLGLLGVAAFTHDASRRRLGRSLGALFAATVAALAVYVPYHLAHGPLFVPDGFRGHPHRVTPFHEQLAAPLFLALGFAVAAVAVAILTSARRPTRRAQNEVTTDGAEDFAGP